MSLPKCVLRMKDLKCVGINNWPTLKRRILKDNFPPGRYVGANTRVWDEAEVERWWATRPSAAPPENVKPAAASPAREVSNGREIKPPLRQECGAFPRALSSAAQVPCVARPYPPATLRLHRDRPTLRRNQQRKASHVHATAGWSDTVLEKRGHSYRPRRCGIHRNGEGRQVQPARWGKTGQ
jgi:predicted DNA-binding transcriptional regulator AlpA